MNPLDLAIISGGVGLFFFANRYDGMVRIGLKVIAAIAVLYGLARLLKSLGMQLGGLVDGVLGAASKVTGLDRQSEAKSFTTRPAPDGTSKLEGRILKPVENGTIERYGGTWWSLGIYGNNLYKVICEVTNRGESKQFAITYHVDVEDATLTIGEGGAVATTMQVIGAGQTATIEFEMRDPGIVTLAGVNAHGKLDVDGEVLAVVDYIMS